MRGTDAEPSKLMRHNHSAVSVHNGSQEVKTATKELQLPVRSSVFNEDCTPPISFVHCLMQDPPHSKNEGPDISAPNNLIRINSQNLRLARWTRLDLLDLRGRAWG
ncbi:hypothetical protein NDU88_008221 [Pleurodeles waltl]|uniref:Uncharacterized protein n=1 Tax=Pleurodeles waltl TaxID=8319 RepID=A0AAV7N7N7_PLEWA|nr:hypothetical protein NDU88_008221 [Pleurodeles waltl]